MIFKRIALFTCIVFFCSCAKHQGLRNKISDISQSANGRLGIAIELAETGDTLSFNGNYHAPMQSVFKFPIALAVLSQVDKGILSREAKIHITKEDLADTITLSPMRDQCHGNDTDITIDDLLHFMVAHSDNIACDVLLKQLGGPKVVMDYLHGLGITGISIVATEAEMHKGWEVQYNNWCEPMEMTRLLDIFSEGMCVSKASTNYLTRIMDSTSTCPKRIKGLLPSGTVVARKSGTSGTNEGLAAATNDVGIITLPNGKHLIISAFVSDSRAADTMRDAVIAKITKAAWDEFNIAN